MVSRQTSAWMERGEAYPGILLLPADQWHLSGQLCDGDAVCSFIEKVFCKMGVTNKVDLFKLI